MSFFTWFRSLWHRNAVVKATETAQVLVDGLSTDQFQVVVDKVEEASKLKISGAEKAVLVRDIIMSARFTEAYKTPSCVQQGIDFASVIVQLAWVVAKLTKRI
jgi:hypothetical protein